MTALFWISGALLLPLAGMSLFFFSLHLGTGEEVPRQRAVALYRWAVVVVLGTFNIWIFERVFQAIRSLMA